CINPQFARGLRLGPAILGEPPLPAKTPAKCDAGEIAFKIVCPIVVDADDLAILTPVLKAQQRAAVRASIFEGVQHAPVVAGYHHRHLAECRGAPRIWLNQLGLQAQEAPARAPKDTLLFLSIDLAVAIGPVRHARIAFDRPTPAVSAGVHGSSSM